MVNPQGTQVFRYRYGRDAADIKQVKTTTASATLHNAPGTSTCRVFLQKHISSSLTAQIFVLGLNPE